MNSYGKVRNFKSEWKGDCPFRYQGQYEGKLFATTYDDAVKFGKLLQKPAFEDGAPFKILTVEVPDDVKPSYFEADGMKAASIEENDLSKLVIKSCK